MLLPSIPGRLGQLLFVYSFALLCAAQTAKGKFVVEGTVVDPSSAAIVGATVELLDEAKNPLERTSTDGAGAFRIEHVGAGKYVLRVEHDGFRAQEQAVTVGERPRTSVKLALQIAVVAEKVTVADEASAPRVSTNEAENQSVVAVDQTTLGRVPMFDMDYISLLSVFLDPNAVATSGVSLVVNGVEANGPGVTASAIKEVKINNNPYSASYSRPGHARIEITTESGTPQFHGTANFGFRDAVFDAAPEFSPIKPPEQKRIYEGSLTGPLGRNPKNTFLISLDRDEQDDQAVVVAQDLNGPVNMDVPVTMRHFFGSARAFHDLGNGSQVWIGYSYEQRTSTNQGVGGTVLPSAATTNDFQEHEVNVGYTKVISPRMINNLHFLIGHYNIPTTSVEYAPKIVVSGAFTSGGSQADGKRTEAHFDGTDVVTYASGRQVMKFGVDIPDISRRGVDDFTNTLGTYYFASLAAYAAKTPSEYLVQRGTGRVVFLEKVVSGIFEDAIQVRPDLSVTVGARYYWQSYFHDVPHDFGPRLAIAYAPGKSRKVVVRAGSGVFYDRTGPGPISDLLHFNGVLLHRYILENPTYPVDPLMLSASPQSLVTLDPNARIPYTVQYSGGIELQATKKSTLTANYIGSRGIDLFRSRDVNAPVPPTYAVAPDPLLGQVRQIESEGYQRSNGLEISYRGNFTSFFSGMMQYRLAKNYNNTSGIGYFPGNSYDPNADWARSDYDRRHMFNMLGVITAKSFFHLGVGIGIYSGLPVNVTTGADNNGDGVLNDRPAGFARNSLHGPGYADLDLNLSHDFLLGKKEKESPRLTVGLSGFNVLNQTNYTSYVGVLGSPFFGQPVLAQPPRRLQFSGQFRF